jgi:hypothetical protein
MALVRQGTLTGRGAALLPKNTAETFMVTGVNAARNNTIVNLAALGIADSLSQDDPELDVETLEQRFPGTNFYKPMTASVARVHASRQQLAKDAQKMQEIHKAGGGSAFANMASDLVVSVATDPLTYVTAGLSMASKPNIALDVLKGTSSVKTIAKTTAVTSSAEVSASVFDEVYERHLTGNANTLGNFIQAVAPIAFGSVGSSIATSRLKRALNNKSVPREVALTKAAKIAGFSYDSFDRVDKIFKSPNLDDSTKLKSASFILSNDQGYKNTKRVAEDVDKGIREAESKKAFSKDEPPKQSFFKDLVDVFTSEKGFNIFDDVDGMPITDAAIQHRVAKYTTEQLENMRIKNPGIDAQVNFTNKVLNRHLYVLPQKVMDDLGYKGFVRNNRLNTVFVSEGFIKDKNFTSFLIGHEFYHTLKGVAPEAVNDLIKIVQDLPPEEFNKLWREWPRKGSFKTGDPSVIEEFMADNLGDAFNSPSFWPLFKQNKNKELQGYITEFLSSVNLSKESTKLSGVFGKALNDKRFFNKAANKRWKMLIKKKEEDNKVYTDYLTELYSDLIQKTERVDIPEIFNNPSSSNTVKAIKRLQENINEMSLEATGKAIGERLGYSINVRNYIGNIESLVELSKNPLGSIVEHYSLIAGSLIDNAEKHLKALDVSKLKYSKDATQQERYILSQAYMKAKGDVDTFREAVITEANAYTRSEIISQQSRLKTKRFNEDWVIKNSDGSIDSKASFDSLFNKLTGDIVGNAADAGNNIATSKQSAMDSVIGPLFGTLETLGLSKKFTGKNPDPVVKAAFRRAAGADVDVPAKLQKEVDALTDVIQLINKHQAGQLFHAGAIKGAIDKYLFPTNHNIRLIDKAGPAKWLNDTLEMLDIDTSYKLMAHNNVKGVAPKEYLTELLKNLYNDLRKGKFNLDEAQDLNNLMSTEQGHRWLRFKAGEEVNYDLLYGNQDPGQAFINSISKRAETLAVNDIMGSDVGLVRNAINTLTDLSSLDKRRIKAVFNQVTGELNNPVNQTMGEYVSVASRLTDLAVLGKSGITSMFSDPVTMTETLQHLGMPARDAYVMLAKSIIAASKRRLKKSDSESYFTGLNIGMDALRGALAKRIGGSSAGFGMVGRLHNTLFSANLLGLTTKVFHEAMYDVYQQHIARSIASLVQGLDVNEKTLDVFRRFGLTQKELTTLAKVLKDTDDIRINPLDIDDKRLRLKVQNMYQEAVRTGVLEPDEASIAYTNLGLRAGTPEGSAARLINKYMSFEVAMLRQIYGRIFNKKNLSTMDGRTQAALAAGRFAVASMGLYYLGSAVKDLLAGKEPKEINKDTIVENFFRSGIAPVLPTLLEKTNLDNMLGMDDSEYGFLGPTVSTATAPLRGIGDGSFYKFANGTMSTLPFNNLPVIHEGKKLFMATLFDDAYGDAYEKALNYQKNRYGQDSIFLPDDE